MEQSPAYQRADLGIAHFDGNAAQATGTSLSVKPHAFG
jgi:hypothetical protein